MKASIKMEHFEFYAAKDKKKMNLLATCADYNNHITLGHTLAAHLRRDIACYPPQDLAITGPSFFQYSEKHIISHYMEPKTYAVQAQVVYQALPRYTTSKSLPTFYLDAGVQGITSKAQAEVIAKAIIDPQDNYLEVHISVEEV